MLSHLLAEPISQSIFWSAITIAMYFLTKKLYRHWPFWWLMPIALTPILVASIILLMQVSYQDYFYGTKWLSLLIGPVTVAFALPIYEQRTLICQHWPILFIGAITGSLTAILSSWSLAFCLGIDEQVRLSLVPRSISTPFALIVSRDIGGIPDLTAIFVVLTGILGAVIGKFLLTRISFHSALAKGALLGVGAHAAGTAHAHKIGSTEGAIASLVMILAGLLNVLLLPSISYLLK
jgi:predicted murein hydrolase (TIGR00659 family)